jgi:hypothetical protein
MIGDGFTAMNCSSLELNCLTFGLFEFRLSEPLDSDFRTRTFEL